MEGVGWEARRLEMGELKRDRQRESRRAEMEGRVGAGALGGLAPAAALLSRIASPLPLPRKASRLRTRTHSRLGSNSDVMAVKGSMLREQNAIGMRDLMLALFRVTRNRTLWECGALVLWLISFAVAVSAIAATTRAYSTSNAVTEALVDEELPDAQYKKSFGDIVNVRDVNEWLLGPVASTFFATEEYSGAAQPEASHGLLQGVQRVVGAVRLRQSRVRPNTCNAVTETDPRYVLQGVSCYGWFRIGDTEETRPWTLQSRSEDGNGTRRLTLEWRDDLSRVQGLYGMGTGPYGTGGYVLDFPVSASPADNAEMLRTAVAGGWIDRGTRLHVLEFTTYDPAEDVAMVARIQLELLPTGYVARDARFESFRPFVYTPPDPRTIVPQALASLFFFYFASLQVYRARLRGCRRHCLRLDTALDLVILLTAAAVLALWCAFVAAPERRGFRTTTAAFVDYSFTANIFAAFLFCAGALFFLLALKLFSHFGVTGTGIGAIWLTLVRAKDDLCAFAFAALVIVLGFALVGIAAFGWGLENFHNLGSALSSLLRFSLGDFDFDELQALRPQLAGWYFALYIAIVFIVAYNLFGGLIIDSFSVVKDEHARGMRWIATVSPISDEVARIAATQRLRVHVLLRRVVRRVRRLCCPHHMFAVDPRHRLETERRSTSELSFAQSTGDVDRTRAVVVVHRKELSCLGLVLDRLLDFFSPFDSTFLQHMDRVHADAIAAATAAHGSAPRSPAPLLAVDNPLSSSSSSSTTTNSGGGGGGGPPPSPASSAASVQSWRRRRASSTGLGAVRSIRTKSSSSSHRRLQLEVQQDEELAQDIEDVLIELEDRAYLEGEFLSAVGRCIDLATSKARVDLFEYVKHLYRFEPHSESMFVTQNSLALLISAPSAHSLEHDPYADDVAGLAIEAYQALKSVELESDARAYKPPIQLFFEFLHPELAQPDTAADLGRDMDALERSISAKLVEESTEDGDQSVATPAPLDGAGAVGPPRTKSVSLAAVHRATGERVSDSLRNLQIDRSLVAAAAGGVRGATAGLQNGTSATAALALTRASQVFFVHKVTKSGQLRRRLLWLDVGYAADPALLLPNQAPSKRAPVIYTFDIHQRPRMPLPLTFLVQLDASLNDERKLILIFSSTGALQSEEEQYGRLDFEYTVIFAHPKRRQAFLDLLLATTARTVRPEDRSAHRDRAADRIIYGHESGAGGGATAPTSSLP